MDILYWFIAGIIGLQIPLIWQYALLIKNNPSNSKEPPHIKPSTHYEKVSALLTPAEQNFFQQLAPHIPQHSILFSKVRIADLVQPVKTLKGSAWQQAFYKICAKHIDFVICDRKNLDIQICIELNDSSHQRPDRIKRDQLVRRICQDAQVKLIEIKAKRRYPSTDFKRILSLLKTS
jgi:hypothetical protein